MLHTIGILEMKVSDNPEDVIITHSLGSCIGLSLYDPEPRIGGLVHCMLPLSEIDPDRAGQHPCMFVDTGVPLLIQEMLGMGAEKARLIAKAAGAASLLEAAKLFCTGERNLAALRSILQEHGIPIAAEDVGGTIARTMSLLLDTGATMIRTCHGNYRLE